MHRHRRDEARVVDLVADYSMLRHQPFPVAGEFNQPGDRSRLWPPAAAVAEFVISQPRGADIEPARELGAVPTHPSAKGDQVLWRHVIECKTLGTAYKRSSRIVP